MKSRTLALAFAVLGGAISIASSAPDSQTLSPVRVYQITAPFTDDDGEVATNISGLACMPTDAARSMCLVIDDQGRFAQISFIGNGQIAAGARLPLIGRRPSRDTVGQPPAETACSDGERKFRDLDGEAVAYAAPFSISSALMAARAIATSFALPLSSWPAFPSARSPAPPRPSIPSVWRRAIGCRKS
jgi:hypothetical protein